MRFRWTLFGREITTLEIGSDIQAIAEEIAEGITGGEAHNFERDLYPPDPNDCYRGEFGFHERA